MNHRALASGSRASIIRLAMRRLCLALLIVLLPLRALAGDWMAVRMATSPAQPAPAAQAAMHTGAAQAASLGLSGKVGHADCMGHAAGGAAADAASGAAGAGACEGCGACQVCHLPMLAFEAGPAAGGNAPQARPQQAGARWHSAPPRQSIKPPIS